MKKILLFLGMYLMTSGINAQPYKIGDKLNGGIIFYIDAKGLHGLIADTKDLGEMNWNDAVSACKSKGSGWYLPNKIELNKLYLQKKIVGEFVYELYWSSTFDNNNTWAAYSSYFSSGSEQHNASKETMAYVRAVRAF